MPPARSIRQRVVNNENDENSGTRRVTRAKAATQTVPEESVAGAMAKKPLANKKSATNVSNTNAIPAQRKRAALGDVSNVTKNDIHESKDGKKPLTAKPGLVSKAAQTAGVQKLSRANSNRSILGAKDANKRPATTELKRPASGSGVMGGASKKRHTGSTGSQPSIKDENVDSENEPPQKKIAVSQVEEQVKVETKREVVLEEPLETVPDAKQTTGEEVPNLDAEDGEDPSMAAEYVGEIFDYLKVLEEATMPNPDYMDHQDHLEWHLRGVLVDWLIEVHTRFHLLPETLFLAINIIDRFLSTRIVELEKLQLVGITAMFIASKYEEVLSPHVSNFRHVADDGFTEEEILKAERFLLQALNYDLSYPNPMNFLRRISKADNYDIQTRTIGKYLLEIGLVDHKFMGYHPSHVAATAMYCARLILERGEWDATLAHYSGYTEEEIRPVFELMVDYLHHPVEHEAFFKKYASKKFLKGKLQVLVQHEEHY
ncbi:G2/mitotic-specific cyclin [Lecanora helva]